nr:helix-turn-helix transcriptional regulator [Lactobacillus delbrueckii]
MKGGNEVPKISVRAARVNAGFSQDEAAKKLGISRFTLQRYESNPKQIRQGMLEKMRVVYNMDHDNLFFKL